jgi:hypothetical protein
MKKNILSLIAVVLGMTLSINNPANASDATAILYFTITNDSDEDVVFGPESPAGSCYTWVGDEGKTGKFVLSALTPTKASYTYELHYQYPKNQSCKNPLVDSFIISKSKTYANGCEVYYSCTIDSTGYVICTSASRHNEGGDSLCTVDHKDNTITVDYTGNPSGGSGGQGH